MDRINEKYEKNKREIWEEQTRNMNRTYGHSGKNALKYWEENMLIMVRTY